MLWGTVPKALQKSRQVTSMAPPLSTGVVKSITEGHYVCQVRLALGEAMLGVLIHLSVPHAAKLP